MSMFMDEFYATQVPYCPGGTIYVIQPGDTFWALARRFGTTVEALIAANPGVDPNRLMVGQRICIPVAPPPPVVCPGFIYVIQPGDTFWALARRFGTTVEALMAANPGVDPARLVVGQRICIPVTPPVCPGFIYVVQPGDTLWLLAQRFGTTVEAILAVNPGIDPARLVVGQRICIPVAPPVPPVVPRTCVLLLAPRVPAIVPAAGGAVWVRQDAAGVTQVLVAAINLPPERTLEPDPYRAVFTWPGGTTTVPMVGVPGMPGVFVGTASFTAPTTLLTAGTVDVFPGPVLGGFLRDCR
ncbi:MAG: LysM domain-containing protein [Firmicutes bacterium]|jgi:LysM repeat protein|nr:LysM domain-containing protein [Bacillota bacterium]